MKFEEQFPGLKGKYEGIKFIQIWRYDLEKHCLDKTKVKEAIDNWNNKEFKGSLKSEIKLLKKELNL